MIFCQRFNNCNLLWDWNVCLFVNDSKTSVPFSIKVTRIDETWIECLQRIFSIPKVAIKREFYFLFIFKVGIGHMILLNYI